MSGAVGRLALDAAEPRDMSEGELLTAYRDSVANDRTMLQSLLWTWVDLSPGHRGIVFRVADALQRASAQKKPQGGA
jgi:hypothetical protein